MAAQEKVKPSNRTASLRKYQPKQRSRSRKISADLAVSAPNGSEIMTAETARKLFTPARIKILQALRDEGRFDSMNDLCELLGRKPANVSGDIQQLVAYGLVESHKAGQNHVLTRGKKLIVIDW